MNKTTMIESEAYLKKYMSLTPLESPLIGDVILIESWGSKGKGNTLIQRVARIPSLLQKFVPTHAAIAAAGQGVFLHATGGEGVVFTSVDYLIDSEKYKPNYKVYRNNKLEQKFQDKSEEEQFYSLSKQYLNAEYEVIFNYLVEDEKKLFCSMLVSKIYKQLEIEVAVNKESHQTLPLDIEKYLTKNPDWKEVTSIYRHLYDLKEGDSLFADYKNLLRATARRLAESHFVIETIKPTMERLHELDNKILEIVKQSTNKSGIASDPIK